MRFFYSLPRVVRDLIIFNSFVFMVKFILNYGFNIDFSVRSSTLMAANVGLLIVHLLNHRINVIRKEDMEEEEKKN